MKKISIAAATVLLGVCGAASAAIVHVSGNGQSFDYGTAFSLAQADANAKCAAKGGTPGEVVYTYASQHSAWFATVIMKCEVP